MTHKMTHLAGLGERTAEVTEDIEEMQELGKQYRNKSPETLEEELIDLKKT